MFMHISKHFAHKFNFSANVKFKLTCMLSFFNRETAIVNTEQAYTPH